IVVTHLFVPELRHAVCLSLSTESTPVCPIGRQEWSSNTTITRPASLDVFRSSVVNDWPNYCSPTITTVTQPTPSVPSMMNSRPGGRRVPDVLHSGSVETVCIGAAYGVIRGHLSHVYPGRFLRRTGRFRGHVHRRSPVPRR